MLVSFVLALVAALPDALLALWLMLLGKGVLESIARVLITAAAIGLACLGDRDLVSAHDQHARAAPLPRQGDDRARIARRPAAGDA